MKSATFNDNINDDNINNKNNNEYQLPWDNKLHWAEGTPLIKSIPLEPMKKMNITFTVSL